MSNRDTTPVEVVCRSGNVTDAQLLSPRAVPLGGPRAMTVRRTLPQRERSLIGAWCFLDHYGPDHVGETGGMKVPRHPHTGLQTVSWLFTGEVEHRDSAGFHAIVRPGELNLMTAGRGISHSEFSTTGTEILHGVQLWIALPDATRHVGPGLQHYRPEPVVGDGWALRVFLGSLGGATSPVATHTALLGAEARLLPGAELRLDLDASFEYGVLVDQGDLSLDDHDLPEHHLAYVPTGRRELRLCAGKRGARLLLIGGDPLGEQIVMWWNFVGRSHEEVVGYRAEWMAEIGAEPARSPAHAAELRFGTFPAGEPAPLPAPAHAAELRFGTFPAGEPAPLPAPALPTVRMRPRG